MSHCEGEEERNEGKGQRGGGGGVRRKGGLVGGRLGQHKLQVCETENLGLYLSNNLEKKKRYLYSY